MDGDGEVSKKELSEFIQAGSPDMRREKERSPLPSQSEKMATSLLQLFKKNEFSLWLIYSHYCPDNKDLRKLIRECKNDNLLLHTGRIASKLLPLERLLKLLDDFGIVPCVCSRDYITSLVSFINTDFEWEKNKVFP